jgi:hypothetical protein
MSTPPEEPGQGGWQPQGWQSEWQRPGGWRREPAEEPQASAGWQQPPDARWTPVGPARSSGKATASLVLGILGLFLFCSFILSLLAVILGYQARREIDASGGQLSGRGNAVVGIVLGWIGVALTVAFIIFVVIGLMVGDSGSSSNAPPVQVSPS